jgi:NitT/TauT family transport system permease protein
VSSLRPISTRLVRTWWIAPFAGVVIFAGLWEAVVRVFDVQPFVLLAPSEIGTELRATPGFFFENALVTGRHMVVGLAISLIVSIAIGAVMASAKFIEEATQPVLVLILVTPWVAYVTSVVTWLNFGEAPIVFMVAFTSLPIFTFGVVGGMKSADPAARELFASIDARRLDVLFRLRLPAALPSIFTTARFATGLGLAAAQANEPQHSTTAPHSGPPSSRPRRSASSGSASSLQLNARRFAGTCRSAKWSGTAPRCRYVDGATIE